MVSWATVQRELKVHFRSSWTISFMVFFTLFTAAILYLSGTIVGLGNYTKTTGTLMNLLAYFLPLMTLVIGAFSLTMEKEEGSWGLLFTYPISSIGWVFGKFLGMMIVLVTIFTVTFSVGGLLLTFTHRSIEFKTMGALYLYALCLMVLFLAIAVCIGGLAKNRWQALMGCVGVWVVFVLAWPIILMSTLHQLPFQLAGQILQLATFFNPLEFTRLFFTIKLGGGAVFGPQYVEFVSWVQQPASFFYFIGLAVVWIVVLLGITVFATERSRSRGA